jgi:hypothetical protein
MKTSRTFALLVSFSLALLDTARAADISGKWLAEFEAQQIGHTKYVFDLKVDGEKLTGKATAERAQLGKTEAEIKNGKIVKDEVSFSETFSVNGNEITVEYKGKLVGDELKLHRKVGEIAEYDIVAKRVKEDAAAKK